ncbi:MAG: uroporphyrinogen-III synthase [Bacteroidota bacterium]
MKVKNILISQPPPSDNEKSPYRDLAEKYNLKMDFHKFFRIEGIPGREFRLDRINMADYTAVIFTSRHAVDHYFRIAKEVRFDVPDITKYFCISEAIALYLQKYVQYRKRKIFHGKQSFPELMDIILKHKEDKFLLPCSDIHKQDMPDLLEKHGVRFAKAIIYKTVDSDLKSVIDINKYDMLVIFSPSGVKSLFNNFPDFEQGEKIIAGFGPTTATAITESGLNISISAPTKTSPSMTMAIEEFLIKLAKKK